MKIQPLGDRSLVCVDDNQTTTAGGLALPDTVRHNVTTGTVVAVGPGRLTKRGRLVPAGVRVGQRVTFRKYSGAALDAFMDGHLMLSPDDILGTVDAG